MTAGTLRAATRRDVPGIQRVRHSVRENVLTSCVISDDEVIEAIGRTGRGWVVDHAGEVVAFAIGNATDGNIWALFVDPEHERRGHGRRLHDAMVAWLWSRGLARLWLTTEPATRAQRFYEKAGWRNCGAVANGELRFEKDAPAPSWGIRRAAAAEAPQLTGLAMRSKALWGYPEQALQAWRAQLTVSAQDVETRPAFVALAGAEIAGFYTLAASGATWELDNLWVAPEWMRRGIGRALLAHALDTAAGGGAAELLVDADPNAERFYVDCGARRRGEVAAPIAGEPGRVRPQLAFDCAIIAAPAPSRR